MQRVVVTDPYPEHSALRAMRGTVSRLPARAPAVVTLDGFVPEGMRDWSLDDPRHQMRLHPNECDSVTPDTYELARRLAL